MFLLLLFAFSALCDETETSPVSQPAETSPVTPQAETQETVTIQTNTTETEAPAKEEEDTLADVISAFHENIETFVNASQEDRVQLQPLIELSFTTLNASLIKNRRDIANISLSTLFGDFSYYFAIDNSSHVVQTGLHAFLTCLRYHKNGVLHAINTGISYQIIEMMNYSSATNETDGDKPVLTRVHAEIILSLVSKTPPKYLRVYADMGLIRVASLLLGRTDSVYLAQAGVNALTMLFIYSWESDILLHGHYCMPEAQRWGIIPVLHNLHDDPGYDADEEQKMMISISVVLLYAGQPVPKTYANCVEELKQGALAGSQSKFSWIVLTTLTLTLRTTENVIAWGSADLLTASASYIREPNATRDIIIASLQLISALRESHDAALSAAAETCLTKEEVTALIKRDPDSEDDALAIVARRLLAPIGAPAEEGQRAPGRGVRQRTGEKEWIGEAIVGGLCLVTLIGWGIYWVVSKQQRKKERAIRAKQRGQEMEKRRQQLLQKEREAKVKKEALAAKLEEDRARQRKKEKSQKK